MGRLEWLYNECMSAQVHPPSYYLLHVMRMRGMPPPDALDFGPMDFLFKSFDKLDEICAKREHELRVAARVARLGPTPGFHAYADTYDKAFESTSLTSHGIPVQSPYVPEWRSDYYSVPFVDRSWRDIVLNGTTSLPYLVQWQEHEDPDVLAQLLSAFEVRTLRLQEERKDLELFSSRLARVNSIAEVNMGSLSKKDTDVFAYTSGKVTELTEAVRESSAVLVREVNRYPSQVRLIFNGIASRILGTSVYAIAPDLYQ